VVIIIAIKSPVASWHQRHMAAALDQTVSTPFISRATADLVCCLEWRSKFPVFAHKKLAPM
jgi:hypothetical protein